MGYCTKNKGLNQMKVLWILNLMPPAVGMQLGKECSVKEGWISGILSRVVKEEEDIDLGICYPVAAKEEENRQKVRIGEKNIICYGKKTGNVL